MDHLKQYRETIERLLREYAHIPYSYGEIDRQVIIDREGDHFILMSVGWINGRRVHSAIVHIDMIEGKIWIQRDGTEDGIANELVQAGIPKEMIVLGFQPAADRPLTEFATA